jgi:hypothetical protein
MKDIMNTKKTANMESKSGQVMILTVVLISGAILSATSLAGLLVMYQLKQSTDVLNSAKAVFAADAGIECTVYNYNVPDPMHVPRGVDCSKWDLSNKSIFTTQMVNATTVVSIGKSGRSTRAFQMDFAGIGP